MLGFTNNNNSIYIIIKFSYTIIRNKHKI